MIPKDLVKDFTTSYIARAVGIDYMLIDAQTSVDVYGLDSAKAIEVTGNLSEELNMEVPPELFFDYPTVEKATDHLYSLMVLKDNE